MLDSTLNNINRDLFSQLVGPQKGYHYEVRWDEEGVKPSIVRDSEYSPLEYHDDNTMFKVVGALESAGLNEQHIQDAVREMQNAGILFREQTVEPEEMVE